MDHHIRLLHEAQGTEGDQVRIAGSSAHQIDLAHAATGAGFGQLAGHDGIGFLQVTGKDAIGDPANQDPIPEPAAITLVREARLDGVSVASADVGKAA